MSDKDTSDPAFPWNHNGIGGETINGGSGITMRDYFAAQAMLPTFMLILETIKTTRATISYSEDSLAEGAYKFADAMLKERSK